MDISSARRTSTETPAPQAQGSSQLGKDEFLRLMMAQLQAQDPTAPQSSEAFVAQLAQFSSVEQLAGLNSMMESLLVAQAANNQTQIAGLVGNDVVYSTDAITLGADGATPVRVTPDANANDVVVTIKDESGTVVRTVHLGAATAEGLDYTWDGLDDQGQPLPEGEYSISATATDAQGNPIDVDVGASGHIDAVSFDGGVPMLVIGGLKIPVADVVQIVEPTTSDEAADKEQP
ncbi:MAG: flagellar hook assembly protein FlgD [Deltaproteobacteria bacterium]|nr:flagellar hook assembly protein FlgD [Deltaproteobacteria bacterium]